MKQSMQDLTDNIEELIRLKVDEPKYPENEREFKELIKQQKIVIGTCLNVLLIEVKRN
jgi:hypothetical protein